MSKTTVLDEVTGLYRIIPLALLRSTSKVTFDCVPLEFLPRIDAIDRVLHEGGATSPGPVEEVARPWYMHPSQDDNLVVLHGTRHVEIYTPEHGRVEEFVVTPNEIRRNGEVIVQGGAMLVWPCRVFHRIRTAEEGSASLNFAVHYQGFDIRTNFNIYDLDQVSGKFRVIREGHLDQPEVRGDR
ncbi:MAG: hypothetical protein KKD63_10080 [Proteobacteria bacterium]|nr:hypothetical protein [Desulfobulbaceae bacterium]MBU4153219.1 hypothetical protein [Pseudomonadota bacterium]